MLFFGKLKALSSSPVTLLQLTDIVFQYTDSSNLKFSCKGTDQSISYSSTLNWTLYSIINISSYSQAKVQGQNLSLCSLNTNSQNIKLFKDSSKFYMRKFFIFDDAIHSWSMFTHTKMNKILRINAKLPDNFKYKFYIDTSDFN